MPWHVSTAMLGCPSDKPFAVLNSDTNALMGCHSSKEEAERQVRALYAQLEEKTDN